jgi:radical SAM protein with 4Fe4S-binding SPASM domain
MTNQEWFKKQLKLIEIEIFSYCNRKCWFCPNSHIDRLSENKILPEEIYIDILSQLKDINYDKDITYSRYNEPLAHRDLIIKRISQARKALPHANLRTNTNGDYVTLDYIQELRDAGLNEIFIQQYLSNNEYYDHSKMKKRMLNKIKQLGVEYSVITDVDNQRIEYDLNIPGIIVHLRARNFAIEGNSRTEKVADFNKEYVRTKPCLQPFNNMYIDYNGSIMVCCNTRSDIEEHSSAIMGNVTDDKLHNIFVNKKYRVWRDHLKDESPKKGVCKECKSDIVFTEFLTIGKNENI